MSRWVTDRSFSAKRATANEKRVMELLKSKWGYDMMICENKYASYDLLGRRGDEGALFEVKERRQAWDELIIEVSKIDKCMSVANHCTLYTVPYLVCSINDKHYIYKMKSIKENGRKDILKCNKTTAQGFRNRGEKVDKEVYYFKLDSYDFILEP